jgi:ribosome-binding factor A
MRDIVRKNSVKNNRINEEVLRVMSELIRSEIKDPRIAPMTSVMDVEVAPDLKTCKAWISVLGNEQARKDTMAGLRSAEGFIRMQLARRVNLRNTPEITFISDESIEYGVNMSKKIDDVIAEDEAKSKGQDVCGDAQDVSGKKTDEDN